MRITSAIFFAEAETLKFGQALTKASTPVVHFKCLKKIDRFEIANDELQFANEELRSTLSLKK